MVWTYYCELIEDENANRFATFKYINGKAVSTEHAAGVDRYVISDERSSGQGDISISDPLGSIRKEKYAMNNGYSRLIQRSQPGGSGCNAATSGIEYDGAGNPSAIIDFSGNKSCVVYDPSNNQQIIRVDGLNRLDNCESVVSEKSTLNPGMQKETIKWHPLWNLMVRQAAPGLITTWVSSS